MSPSRSTGRTAEPHAAVGRGSGDQFDEGKGPWQVDQVLNHLPTISRGDSWHVPSRGRKAASSEGHSASLFGKLVPANALPHQRSHLPLDGLRRAESSASRSRWIRSWIVERPRRSKSSRPKWSTRSATMVAVFHSPQSEDVSEARYRMLIPESSSVSSWSTNRASMSSTFGKY